MLNPKQKLFCQEYTKDWNAKRAYQKVYKCGDKEAEAHGSRLVRNGKVQEYCTEIQKDLEKLCQLSKQMMVIILRGVAISDKEDTRTRIAAITEINKMFGYNAPEKFEDVGKKDTTIYIGYPDNNVKVNG